MQKFMVTISLPAEFTSDYLALIPKQRAMIVRLLSKGKLSSFSLNSERTTAWMVANCKDRASLQKMLDKFPMNEFFSYEISALILHDTEWAGLPKMVLN